MIVLVAVSSTYTNTLPLPIYASVGLEEIGESFGRGIGKLNALRLSDMSSYSRRGKSNVPWSTV